MLQEQASKEATNDVAFTMNGVKHKLTASGKVQNGMESTNYWNSRDRVVLETNIPASLNPIEKLTALKEYVNAAHGRRARICDGCKSHLHSND